MPDRHLYLVFSSPVQGREDDYNDWYDQVHLADVRRIPGVVGATRFEYVPTSHEQVTAPPTQHRYLAVYELDGDPEDVIAELLARAGGPQLALSDALDVPGVTTSVWAPRPPGPGASLAEGSTGQRE
jgi:hypothetical protein